MEVHSEAVKRVEITLSDNDLKILESLPPYNTGKVLRGLSTFLQDEKITSESLFEEFGAALF